MYGGIYFVDTGEVANLGQTFADVGKLLSRASLMLTLTHAFRGEFSFTISRGGRAFGSVFFKGENLDVATVRKFEIAHNTGIVPFIVFKRKKFIISTKRASLVSTSGELLSNSSVPKTVMHKQINASDIRQFTFLDTANDIAGKEGKSPVYTIGYAKGVAGFSYVALDFKWN